MKLLRRLFGSPESALKDAIGTYDIPAFPEVGRQLLSLLQDPDVDFHKVVVCMERDPGLVALVMRSVNAAGFGTRRTVDSLELAVSMLGMRTLESMVVSATVPAIVNQKNGLPKKRLLSFWTTAARRAFMARALAERLSPSTAASSYVAALLQDMALPLLLQHRGKDYEPLLEAWAAGEITDLTAEEQSRFGWDHQRVAGWMCEMWSLPPALQAAIEHHHEEEGAPLEVQLVARLPEGVAPRDCEPFEAGFRGALEGEVDDVDGVLDTVIDAAAQRADKMSAGLAKARVPRPRKLRAVAR